MSWAFITTAPRGPSWEPDVPAPPPTRRPSRRIRAPHPLPNRLPASSCFAFPARAGEDTPIDAPRILLPLPSFCLDGRLQRAPQAALP